MAAFDIRIQAISLFMWLCIIFVVRTFSMLEIIAFLTVFAVVVAFAAVRYTAKPTDLSEDI